MDNLSFTEWNSLKNKMASSEEVNDMIYFTNITLNMGLCGFEQKVLLLQCAVLYHELGLVE